MSGYVKVGELMGQAAHQLMGKVSGLAESVTIVDTKVCSTGEHIRTFCKEKEPTSKG